MVSKCLIFVVLVLGGCVFQTKQRGFVFPKELDAEVAALKTTADLQRVFGSPQAKTIHGDAVWIYYGADENYRGPLPLTYGNKTALLVWSDKSGKITKKKILRDKDLPQVWIDPDETPIPAAVELNALEELVNNIGRFTPAGLGQ